MQRDKDDDDLTAADRELESALKSLAPTRASNVSPIDAAYAAGSRAGRGRFRLWQSAAAAMLLVAIGGWVPLFSNRASTPSPTVIATTPPPPPPIIIASTSPAAVPPVGHNLLTIQDAVRERGADGLPTTELPTIRNLRVADFF